MRKHGIGILIVDLTLALGAAVAQTQPTKSIASVSFDSVAENRTFEAANTEEFLRTADIVSQERVGEGINNPLKVLLEKDGIQMYAVFRDVRIESFKKEFDEGNAKWFFRDDARFECAAYELSKLLGLSNVPPTVERKIQDKEGTLQLWINDAMTRKAMKKRKLEPPSAGMDRWRWMMQWQIVLLFDSLIYNEDRNLGNILIEPETWKLWMIDHTRSFRRRQELLQPEKIRYCERTVWQKLQTLNETVVSDRLVKFLNRDEINGLIKRIDLLVACIKSLIAQHGEKDVLFTLR